MTSKKIWIGRWLVAVAALHTAFGLLLGGRVLPKLLERGIVNSVGNDPMVGMVVWFLLFGIVLMMVGLAVTELERSASFRSARALGLSLFLLCLTGVVLMPVSGFWLAFPPAIALIMRGQGLQAPMRVA